ncbi:hypothetical protein BHE74_00020998 [Ensete ventricosum]|nr:hypothetical protein GW17_00002785 [Ensete ventricosum]RWW71266.1 hypothetical protein BHE74_00020998 [Ensete ventricosum]RZR78530.1 hypothetical protein BHM03_00003893 [Ensete ventricosum]
MRTPSLELYLMLRRWKWIRPTQGWPELLLLLCLAGRLEVLDLVAVGVPRELGDEGLRHQLLDELGSDEVLRPDHEDHHGPDEIPVHIHPPPSSSPFPFRRLSPHPIIPCIAENGKREKSGTKCWKQEQGRSAITSSGLLPFVGESVGKTGGASSVHRHEGNLSI